jgi:hypothetical protein
MPARWMGQMEEQNRIAEAKVRYAWVVDKEWKENDNATHWRQGKWVPIEGGEVTGPSGATDEEIAKARKGTPFRMDYDGDGPALKGRMWTSDAEDASLSEASFQPLEDYGEGGYGCTAILYYNKTTKAWEEL